MKGRRRTAPPASRKPVDASTGAPLLRKFMLKLFDREDGKAADWPLIAETLLQETLHALDQSPDNPRAAALLQRAHEEAYGRLAGRAPDGLAARAGQGVATDTFNGQALRPGQDVGPKAS